MKSNEAFIVWMQQTYIKYLERYSLTDLYNRYLKWYGELKYPLSEKYRKQKYSFHMFSFYMKEYLKTIGNQEALEAFEFVAPKEKQKEKKQEKSEIQIKEKEEVQEEIIENIQQVDTINTNPTLFSEEEVFEQIKSYTKSICDVKSHDYSLLISGDPGLGKTYEVERILESTLGDKTKERVSGYSHQKPPQYLEWIEGPTKIPPKELYCFLWRENGKVILLDDADDFMDNPTSINIIKKVLDSKPVRSVGYGSKPIILNKAGIDDEDIVVPNSFDFYGRVIVITNRYFSDINNAIKSRSLVCEVDLSAKECLKRIKRLKMSIVEQTEDSSERLADEVLEHLQKISHLYEKLDLRTFKQSLQERIRNPYKWKRLIERSIFLKNKK